MVEEGEDEHKLEWRPNIGLGNLYFGDSVNQCKSLYPLKSDSTSDFCDNTTWQEFFIENKDIYLEFEENKLIVIMCFDNITYQQQDIIGMNLIDFSELVTSNPEIGNNEPVIYENGDVEEFFDFDELGVTVSCSDNIILSINLFDGRIVN